MLQPETPFTLDPQFDRFSAIREAYNRDRSQMTLMLAHKLQIPEVDILRALQGDTAHELDFSHWEEIIRAFEASEMYTSSFPMEQPPSKSAAGLASSPTPMAS